MQAKHLLSALLFATASTVATAGGIESFVGKSPSRLLKQEPQFAKAYRAAIKDQDLPDWTNRLAVGFPAERVELGGKTTFLTSACNPQGGCGDERIYILYVPDEKSITAFFFLPPNTEASGDHRMALSRWLGGVPPKDRSDYLLQRAMDDTRSADEKAAAKEAATSTTK